MKTKILITTALYIFLSYNCYCQVNFQKNFGGFSVCLGADLVQANDGGFVLAGRTLAFGAGNYDVYLIKTDALGDTVWNKTFGGTDGDVGLSIAGTSDSGFVITGSTLSFGGGNTYSDVYVVKIDGNGVLQWSKAYGLSGDELGNHIEQTSDGGYIIAGRSTPVSSGKNNVYLLKLNSSGTIDWSGIYQLSSGSDVAYSIKETSDNGFIVAGNSGSNPTNLLLMKTDNAGSVQWTRAYDADTLSTMANIAYDVIQLSNGDYVACGTNYNNTSYDDIFLVKTSSSGNLLWSKTIPGFLSDRPGSIAALSGGGYVVSGSTSSFNNFAESPFLLKINANDNIEWFHTYESVDMTFGSTVIPCADNGFAIAGGYAQYLGINLVKTDATGSHGCDSLISVSYSSPATKTYTLTPSITPGSSEYVAATIEKKAATNFLVNCALQTTVGIDVKEPVKKNCFIYPNPFSSDAFLHTEPALSNATLTIYNSFGQMVKQLKNISGRNIALHGNNLPGGIYFLYLAEDNRIIAAEKFVISD